MFNPAVISRLRQALDAFPRLEKFEQHCLARLELRRDPSAKAICAFSLKAHVGLMRRPELIAGEPEDPSCLNGIFDGQLNRPAPVIQEVHNSYVIGNDTVIDESGQIYSPTAVETASDIERLITKNRQNHQGFVIKEYEDFTEAVFSCTASANLSDKSVLFLHNIEPGNYGSFIFRQVPQIFLARLASLEFDYYVLPDRTPWMMEALRTLAMPNRPVFSVKEVSGTKFKKIYVANQFDAEGFLSPDFIPGLREIAGSDIRPIENIYISRALSTNYRPDYRVMTNEPEVEKIARSLGFRIVYPETLTFVEQARTFASAKRIVGPSGSGMLNAVFASPGCKVGELESFSVCVRQHAKIYVSTDKRYAYVFGRFLPEDQRAKHLRSWSMPKKDIMKIMEWVLE